MEGKNSFAFYTNWKEIFDKFDYVGKGQLIDMLIAYTNDLIPEDEDVDAYVSEHNIGIKVYGAFIGMQPILKQDLRKWKHQREINIENGKKGGRPKKEKETELTEKTESVISKPKKAVNVNVNVNDNILSNDNINNTLLHSEKRTEQLFDKFWSEYPKKEAKKVALKSWMKIKNVEILFDTIMDKLQIFKKTKQWNRDSGQYIPQASTWLNQERWNDEIKIEEILNQYLPKEEPTPVPEFMKNFINDVR